MSSKYTEQDYILQYKTDKTEWEDYTQEFEVSENGNIGMRLKCSSASGDEQYGKVKNKEINWIDRTAPELEIEDDPIITANSITVNVTAEDTGSG